MISGLPKLRDFTVSGRQGLKPSEFLLTILFNIGLNIITGSDDGAFICKFGCWPHKLDF